MASLFPFETIDTSKISLLSFFQNFAGMNGFQPAVLSEYNSPKKRKFDDLGMETKENLTNSNTRGNNILTDS